MASQSEIKELYSRTIVNGVVTEDIHLFSQNENGKMELRGKINGQPIHLSRNDHTSHIRRPVTKKVRFAKITNSVSNALDRMPTPFAPLVVYKTKSRSRRTKKQKRRKTRRNKKDAKRV